MTSLKHIAAMLRSEGVEVRFVLPPIARTVLQAMGLAKGTSLLETLRDRHSGGDSPFMNSRMAPRLTHRIARLRMASMAAS